MGAPATIRIATRGSDQALTQARAVAAQLTAATDVVTDLIVVDTFGDRTQATAVPLHTIGGQGVFVKEVQQAVLDDRADIAVHSAKDLPTAVAAGLTIAAFTARRNAADALVGRRLADLAYGGPVATGSVRRRAQLGRARPDLTFRELRGNIPTRLERVPDGGSIVIAVAALEVLELTDRIADLLDPAEFVPAVGQGCVAVECRARDARMIDTLALIDDPATRAAVTVERAFLSDFGSGCSLPIGAYVSSQRLYLFVAGERGHVVNETVELTGDTVADVERARAAAATARRRVGA